MNIIFVDIMMINMPLTFFKTLRGILHNMTQTKIPRKTDDEITDLKSQPFEYPRITGIILFE